VRAYVTPELINQALLIVEPAIIKMLNGPAKRKDLNLICLRPDAMWDVMTDFEERYDRGEFDDQFVARSFDFGDSKSWEWDYGKYARAKAWLTLRTRKPSGWCQEHPAILLPGDVKYRGSWITESGIITAASGVESHWDEWAARLLGETIDMLAYHQHQAIMTDEGRDYV
jgi:hypothetical protein